MRISRWLLGPALALSLISLPSVGADAAEKPDPDSGIRATPLTGPKVELDGPKRSKAALKALAGQLDKAAAVNRMSVKELADELADPTAWVARNGRLFYADSFERPTSLARTSTGSATGSIPPAPKPLASTFQLHSKPGSAHTIYLDFNGGTLDVGAWSLNNFKKGDFKGFSLDTDYATFTDSERAWVQNVWQVVSEKYAAFDVDVTTQNPGPDGYNRFGAGDATYGDHVVFTDAATGSAVKPTSVCPEGCDGISWKDTFDDPDDDFDYWEPTWVYTNWYQYHWFPGLAADVAAHEIGHTFGLSHDGLGAGGGDPGSGDDEYYGGDALWSPIMGNGFGAVEQFSKGEYNNASNPEDDLDLIATNGAPERPDDWGDLGSPNDLGAQDTYAVDGVIENATDTDVFQISRACTSNAKIKVNGIGSGQAVDLRLTVWDATGTTQLAQDDPKFDYNLSSRPFPATGLDASLDLDTPDTFLVQVDGVEGYWAQGNDTPRNTDYGSIGQYHLTVSGCAGTNGEAPAQITTFTGTQTPKTGTLTLNWQAPDQGGSPITAYRITGLPAGTVEVPGTDRSAVFTGLTPGRDYFIGIAAVNGAGAGTEQQLTQHMNSWMVTAPPTVTASAYGSTITVKWKDPANPGRAVPTAWTVRIYLGSELLDEFQTDYGGPGVKLTGVPNNTFKVMVWLNYDADDVSGHGPGVTKTVPVGPSATRIGTPSSGAAGGAVNVTARWAAPATLRGQKITSYTVIAYKLSASNKVVRGYASSPRSATARSYTWALPAGRYKFRVQAHATGGWTPVSGYSSIAVSR